MEWAEAVDFLAAQVRLTGQTEEETVARLWPTILPQLSERGRRTMLEFCNLSQPEFYRRLVIERARLAAERLLARAGNC